MQVQALVRKVVRGTQRSNDGGEFETCELMVEFDQPLTIEQVRVPTNLRRDIEQWEGQQVILPVRPAVRDRYLNWYLTDVPQTVDAKKVKVA